MRGQADLLVRRRTRFSPCRTWRYALEIIWDERKRPLVVCGLNPSKADEVDNDTTISLLSRLAREGGFGGLIMLNLFGLVSTDPGGLLRHPDPLGPELYPYYHLATGLRVVAAWGAWPRAHVPWEMVAPQITALRAHSGGQLYALALTKAGDPGHPLRKKLLALGDAVPWRPNPW